MRRLLFNYCDNEVALIVNPAKIAAVLVEVLRTQKNFTNSNYIMVAPRLKESLAIMMILMSVRIYPT